MIVEVSIKVTYHIISFGENVKMFVWEKTVAIVIRTKNPALRIARNAPNRVILKLVAVDRLFFSDKVLFRSCSWLFFS